MTIIYLIIIVPVLWDSKTEQPVWFGQPMMYLHMCLMDLFGQYQNVKGQCPIGLSEIFIADYAITTF